MLRAQEIIKHPDERLTIIFDFEEFNMFASGEQIATINSVEASNSDISIDNKNKTATTAKARFSGGNNGQTYLIKFTVTTNFANKFIGIGVLTVNDEGFA